jgi:hypothetical protein
VVGSRRIVQAGQLPLGGPRYERRRVAAEECRRLAGRTIDPVEKQELQRIADEWLGLLN